MAEDGPEKQIPLAASAGSAAGFLDGVQLGWAETVPNALSAASVCVRTDALHGREDSERLPEFATRRERAKQFGMQSAINSMNCFGQIGQGANVINIEHFQRKQACKIHRAV
jgi:hypothetical protein